MQLKEKTIKELQKILKKDYGMSISKNKANDLGGSLLKLANLALNVQDRKSSQPDK